MAEIPGVITPADIERWAPSLPSGDQNDLTAEAVALVRRHAPCVASGSDDLKAEARGIIRRVVQAAVAADASIGYSLETIGPFTARMEKRGASLATASDIAALAALCGGTTSSGLPLGSFQDAMNVCGLFAERRRAR